ncbi:MAG: hypothetical protein P8188_08010, partial [Gemmatimonadota bacterium]
MLTVPLRAPSRLPGRNLVGSLLAVALLGSALPGAAQDAPPLESSHLSFLKARNLGGAFMSGRISDLAVDPTDPRTWYVTAASGGVWKTTNAGVTFEPI